MRGCRTPGEPQWLPGDLLSARAALITEVSSARLNPLLSQDHRRHEPTTVK
jgi:hypothetical protein